METKQVFLSYSRTDREACLVMQSALKQAGLTVFRDEDATRGGDRWMGGLQDALKSCFAFVVLVGRNGIRGWVWAEVQIALRRSVECADDTRALQIFPVLLDGAMVDDLPPFLALRQAVRWSPAIPVPDSFIEAVRTGVARYEDLPVLEGCPFVGLNAFTQTDSKLFFGRQKETLDALACLGDQRDIDPRQIENSSGTTYYRWLQIEGNSGTGKSSLVKAGMLPMIEQGALWARTGFRTWRILGPMMPGSDPMVNLAGAVEAGLVDESDQRDRMRRLQHFQAGERALASALADAKLSDGAFLLVVDQFEELFTFSNAESRRQFEALLANALRDSECPLFLITTVRADFLDRYDHLPQLQAIYNSHCRRYLLPAITEQGLREAIEGPARLAQLNVSEVVTAILKDALEEPGALPLVENALYTLWQQREGNRLKGEHYRTENGIAGMLRSRADSLLQRINREVPSGRQAALELLLRLTRVNEEGRHARQRITREEAVMTAGNGREVQGERVVHILSGERALEVPSTAPSGALRLITISEERGRQYVDLIHETLIRARTRDKNTGKLIGYWPTLYDYVEKNRDRDIHRQQLRLQAERWNVSGRLARILAAAGWGNLWRYRKLRVPSDSPEGRFLAFSRRITVGQLAIVAATGLVAAEAYYWTVTNGLPLKSMLTLERYRLGYAPIPEMVGIPAGSFDIGEQELQFLNTHSEQDKKYFGIPTYRVAVPEPFGVGKYEVTYDEFDYYVWVQHRAGRKGIAYPPTAKGGRGRQPVANVTWHEASAYTDWLSERTQQNCRLPTEAEWEYVARGGTTTSFWWGSGLVMGRATCTSCGTTYDGEQAAPVGNFEANRWGLHDTAGNVWEWTCSEYRETFTGREQRCAAREDNDEPRVMRGGGWDDKDITVRSSYRSTSRPSFRSGSFGFRVRCS